MKKLSIIIPIYNEEKTLSKLIGKVKTADVCGLKKEIILVNDGSTDNSGKIINKLKGKYKVIYHKKNKGKGAAIITALKNVTGDIIIIQDADLEYNPHEYSKLIKPILNNGYSVVYGSRLLNNKFILFGKNKIKLPLHYMGNLFLTFVTNVIHRTKITDMETCYKLFKKEVISNMKLKSERFGFEPEITSKILKRGYKIKEVPISFNPRLFGEGKKINCVDGLKAFFYLIYFKFFD